MFVNIIYIYTGIAALYAYVSLMTCGDNSSTYTHASILHLYVYILYYVKFIRHPMRNVHSARA